MEHTLRKTARKTAALRRLLQKRVSRDGITEKNRESMKKLYLYEAAALSDMLTVPSDLSKLTDALFGTAFVLCAGRGIKLFTEMKKGEIRLINIRFYEILVSLMASSAAVGGRLRLDFSLTENTALFTLCGDIENFDFIKTAALAGGVVLREGNRYAVFLPTEKTNRRSVNIKSEAETLSNPCLAFNVFFRN